MDSRQKAILLITSLGSFLTPFMGSSINIAIPQIGTEFFSDAILLSWVATSYLLASAILVVPMGRLADMRGRTKIFLAGVALYTACSLLSAMVPSVEYLIACRVFQGIGGAMIFSTAVAIITSAMPPNLRGTALGINVSVVYAGLTLGPFIGGLITEFFGWRSIFYFNFILGVLIFIASLKYLHIDEKKDKNTKFDLLGSVFYAGFILCLMLGFQEIQESFGLLLFALAVIFLIVFLGWEKMSPNPVFEISLITKNRVFALSNLAALINYSATYAIGFLLSIYLQTIRGFDPFTAGLILIAQPLLQTVFSPVTGRLSDKYNSSYIATLGMGFISAGLLLFAGLNVESSIYMIIGNLCFLGFGFALFSSPNTHVVMNSVDERRYGVASGILGTMRLCGMMASMGISMLAFSLTIGREALSEAELSGIMSGINIAFAIFLVLCIIGTFASLVRKKNKKKTEEISF
ncbi:MFS transporter [Methanomicrobium antiquum]|uniref:MFS transporter n=1 Tax=Methanomicrobium antiquum TaxID=487686 RepID=A0AAF0FMF4_9EURY|nr:MFS transporter [Methanomicrobium antiquum]WFN36540.1 MFS transporter [Methanomicrobium antiquum]